MASRADRLQSQSKVRLAWHAATLVTLILVSAPRATLHAQDSATVRVDGANLRSDARMNAPIVRRLPRGTAVAVLEQRADWLRVRSGSTDGWVRTSLMQLRAPSATATRSVPPSAAPAPAVPPASDSTRPTADGPAAEDAVDPRLAGRRAASGGPRSRATSMDRSRLGVWGGWAGLPGSGERAAGPSIGGFARARLGGSPIAARVEAQYTAASRDVSFGSLGTVQWRERFTQLQGLLEIGVPISPSVEPYGIAGAGFVRWTTSLGGSLPLAGGGQIRPPTEATTTTGVSVTMGVGVKLRRHLFAEVRFFDRFGPSPSLLAGLRL